MKNSIKNIGKYLILKKIYPHIYYKYSRKPIEQGKTIFLEVRSPRLSNNLKCMYDKISMMEGYNIKCHYLCEGIGSKVKTFNATKTFLKDMATAQYVFLSEANHSFACFTKRKETKVVQLWHGCGAFKKFGLSTGELKFGSSKKQQEKYPLYNNIDLVTVSSPEVIWAYEEAMGLKPGIVKATGISRTDVFFDVRFIEESKNVMLNVVPDTADKKILLYAPTFRGTVTNAKAPDRLDIELLKEEFEDEFVLLIKHHPFIKNRPEIPASCSHFAFDVTKEINIEQLLCVSDICISDYSSLVFEYALFERPMIFFAYDLDEYNGWRGFYYDYDELTPGPVVGNTDKVIECIKEYKDGEEVFSCLKKIQLFKKVFMSSCDGEATERIFEGIKCRKI